MFPIYTKLPRRKIEKKLVKSVKRLATNFLINSIPKIMGIIPTRKNKTGIKKIAELTKFNVVENDGTKTGFTKSPSKTSEATNSIFTYMLTTCFEKFTENLFSYLMKSMKDARYYEEEEEKGCNENNCNVKENQGTEESKQQTNLLEQPYVNEYEGCLPHDPYKDYNDDYPEYDEEDEEIHDEDDNDNQYDPDNDDEWEYDEDIEKWIDKNNDSNENSDDNNSDEGNDDNNSADDDDNNDDNNDDNEEYNENDSNKKESSTGDNSNDTYEYEGAEYEGINDYISDPEEHF